ncbi:phosphotransferase family protein [Microbacterium sp. MPKO10]|uniref:phosphotransferase family protein n=1 Tax=Microbacterium sp. MPKO10 TaxID=2989818 RepID=UPI002235F6FB|nr:aminoglycoside phosphotransferase family protein [Microbacterium sp. MPKO10]MCW4458417.1 aminoglycoside phosphotransferase family protein [Microbacterium sp. MPKO10]
MDATPQTRQLWTDLPETLTTRIGALIGDVVSAESQPRGFSTGVAARVTTSTGGRAFVKAADRRRNAGTVDLHRREAEILRELPLAPVAPRLIGAADDADWFALVVEDIEGRHPGTHTGDTVRVLDALHALPPLTDDHGLPVSAEAEAEAMRGWHHLDDAPSGVVPPWAEQHREVLAECADGAAEALRGESLQHVDTRDDNILIELDGTVRIIDWPWASIGCGWFDALGYLIDARMRGERIDTAALLEQHPVFADATVENITAVLAGLAGHFLDKGRRPAPPFMPALRAFQRAEGLTALAWACERVERAPRTK